MHFQSSFTWNTSFQTKSLGTCWLRCGHEVAGGKCTFELSRHGQYADAWHTNDSAVPQFLYLPHADHVRLAATPWDHISECTDQVINSKTRPRQVVRKRLFSAPTSHVEGRRSIREHRKELSRLGVWKPLCGLCHRVGQHPAPSCVGEKPFPFQGCKTCLCPNEGPQRPGAG